MKRKVLLFLSAHHFHARIWQDGALSPKQIFANHDGREKFSAFLGGLRDPVLLLTDLIEEDFRHEIVLHLRGQERNAQLQRKFEQFYRNTPFRQAILHQRQEEGRRDDEMLFSALTNPHILAPWLEVMQQQHAPLAGIYSVPTISQPLIADIPEDHILLLSWEKHAGLRQSYFNAKRLYLSRLTPITEGKKFAEVVAAETVRTQQYLKSLGLLSLGQKLNVHIICHESDRNEFAQTLSESTDMEYAFLDIQQVGAKLKLKEVCADSDATGLLLHLLAIQPPPSHYASSAHTHFFGLGQLRRRLYWAGALIAGVSLLWGMFNLWEGRMLAGDSEELVVQARQFAQRSQQIIHDFPNQLASPHDMKSAVTARRALDAYPSAPQVIWSGLAATLDEFPRIRIDRMSWQTGVNSTPLSSELHGAGMVISGELEEWDGDYRAALDYLEHFQQALKQRNYEVAPLSLPVDVSSRSSIADSPAGGRGKSALFSLRLTWRQTP